MISRWGKIDSDVILSSNEETQSDQRLGISQLSPPKKAEKPDELSVLHPYLTLAKRAATMSETSGESAVDAVPTFASFPKHPKRVILRLRVNEFDGRNPTEFDRAIMAYLASAGRPVDELTQRIHHSHIEPLQPPEMKQRSFHIVLDIEKDMLSDPEFETVEHEVHRVHRAKNGTLYGYHALI